MDLITVSAFSLYLLVVVAIALVAYQRTQNLGDFVLGGRQLGGPVAALSAGASDMSAWLLLGLPGAVYTFGLNQIWLPIGLTVGAYISWRIIAKPLRVYSQFANDSLTLPAFLDNRFLDNSGIIRCLLALVTLFFFAFYTASGLVGGAVLLQRFNISYTEALWLGTAIIVAYTFIGGFLAVSWTDFFQGSFMFICLLLVPFIAVAELGGWSQMAQTIQNTTPEKLKPFQGFNALLFFNLMAWGLGYFGQPHILVRFMAVKTLKDITIARRICVGWMSFSMMGAVLIGIVGVSYFYQKELHPESIFILFSQSLFSPWLAGILFAAILSSIMCAIDSQMLASSSALTEDIYHKWIHRNAKPKHLMWIGRFAIIVIAAVAVYLARDPESRVIHLVAFAWAGLGSAFGPAVIGALYWRRMTAKGAMAGIVVGAFAVIIWHLKIGGIFDLYEIIPGFFLGTLAMIIGSLLDVPPAKEITDQFDEVKAFIKASQK
ncbi:sodium/proline symporter PutP [Candidatus Berkiella cookevillensis]|uniref:Sodium/proline symporter n=1 Tax=Candidatus Berkiella cookevillensis TaxID=437022 RepID=A0A0Q9YCZ2_9GAMM|nr:sodium/proline symporter PutP [Candidatus Berkiella cookevillensis]MCS5708189.1 sodium/proline symporter PutP [Candidatus Berkiella cookevillensis]